MPQAHHGCPAVEPLRVLNKADVRGRHRWLDGRQSHALKLGRVGIRWGRRLKARQGSNDKGPAQSPRASCSATRRRPAKCGQNNFISIQPDSPNPPWGA